MKSFQQFLEARIPTQKLGRERMVGRNGVEYTHKFKAGKESVQVNVNKYDGEDTWYINYTRTNKDDETMTLQILEVVADLVSQLLKKHTPKRVHFVVTQDKKTDPKEYDDVVLPVIKRNRFYTSSSRVNSTDIEYSIS